MTKYSYPWIHKEYPEIKVSNELYTSDSFADRRSLYEPNKNYVPPRIVEEHLSVGDGIAVAALIPIAFIASFFD